MDERLPLARQVLFIAGGIALIVLGTLQAERAIAFAVPALAIGALFFAIGSLGKPPSVLRLLGARVDYLRAVRRAQAVRGKGHVTAPAATFEGHGTVHPVGKSLTLRWRVEDPAERTPEKYEQLAMFARSPEEFGEIVEEAIRAVDERARDPERRG